MVKSSKLVVPGFKFRVHCPYCNRRAGINYETRKGRCSCGAVFRLCIEVLRPGNLVKGEVGVNG